ncbi:dCTP deaminase, partial [Bacteroidota bacterium]
DCLGINSYDIHLGRHLLTFSERVLDARTKNPMEEIIIPKDGLVINPGTFYLDVSEEYTETNNHVPFLEGISSAARLGIIINPSSGKGSIGHCNTWTIEFTPIHPVRIYAGMPIAQLFFLNVDGPVDIAYSKLKTAKYNSRSIKPTESKMWKNEF